MMTSGASFVGMHFHWLFAGLLTFGFVAALFYLHKHADKKLYMQIVWGALIIGAVGMILTANVGARGFQQLMAGHHGYGGYNVNQMMDYMGQKFQENGVTFDRNDMLKDMAEHMYGN